MLSDVDVFNWVLFSFEVIASEINGEDAISLTPVRGGVSPPVSVTSGSSK